MVKRRTPHHHLTPIPPPKPAPSHPLRRPDPRDHTSRSPHKNETSPQIQIRGPAQCPLPLTPRATSNRRRRVRQQTHVPRTLHRTRHHPLLTSRRPKTLPPVDLPVRAQRPTQRVHILVIHIRLPRRRNADRLPATTTAIPIPTAIVAVTPTTVTPTKVTTPTPAPITSTPATITIAHLKPPSWIEAHQQARPTGPLKRATVQYSKPIRLPTPRSPVKEATPPRSPSQPPRHPQGTPEPHPHADRTSTAPARSRRYPHAGVSSNTSSARTAPST